MADANSSPPPPERRIEILKYQLQALPLGWEKLSEWAVPVRALLTLYAADAREQFDSLCKEPPRSGTGFGFGLRPARMVYFQALHNLRLQLLEFLDTLAQRETAPTPWEAARAARTGQPLRGGWNRKQRVFVVHGHNQGAKHEVARVLERLDLDAVILHEQSNIPGETLIAKVQRHADVKYAVVLLTSDDVGQANAERIPRPRARQNVVYEMGYFSGKLGAGRVLALFDKEIERPSDLEGVLWVPYLRGWELDLINDMKRAGLSVDANRLQR